MTDFSHLGQTIENLAVKVVFPRCLNKQRKRVKTNQRITRRPRASLRTHYHKLNLNKLKKIQRRTLRRRRAKSRLIARPRMRRKTRRQRPLKPLTLMTSRRELLTTLRLRLRMRMETLRFKTRLRNSQSVIPLKRSSTTLKLTLWPMLKSTKTRNKRLLLPLKLPSHSSRLPRRKHLPSHQPKTNSNWLKPIWIILKQRMIRKSTQK